MDSKLFDFLQSHKIDFKEFKHPPMFKVSDEQDMKNKIPGEKSKNLFLKDDKENFYLVIWPAYSKLPMSKLKKFLKAKELEFASPEELKKNLNVTPGSVSIFSMIHSSSVNLLVNKKLYDSEHSGYHPNENTSTLVLSRDNLHKFLISLKIKFEIISFPDE